MYQLTTSNVLSERLVLLSQLPFTFIVFIACFVIGAAFLSIQYGRFWYYCRGKKVPPGSFGLPLIGETLSLAFHLWRNKFDRFTKIRSARYGSIFKTHIFGKPYVVVSGPKAGRMMTVLEHKTFTAYPISNFKALLGSRSVLVIYGDPHKRFRQLVNDAFSPESLRYSLGKIEHVALDVLRSWKVGQVYNTEHESSTFAFNIIASLLMGWMPGPRTRKAEELHRVVTNGFVGPRVNFPGFAFYNAMKARGELKKMCEEEIEKRTLNDKDVKHDILQTMLNARDQQGGMLSKEDITDNVISFILGGTDTTTSTIAFIVQLLNDHPNALEELRAEHEAIAKTKDLNTSLTWEDYKKMVYTEKVILEAARMESLVFWWIRSVAQDFEFEGYQIPKGWKIIFDLTATHHLPQYFSDPYSFNPSRFDKPQKPNTFMPWGAGSRICPGMNLAKLEISIFIHHLIRNFKWEGTLPNMGLDYFGLPTPKGGVPIMIKQRLM